VIWTGLVWLRIGTGGEHTAPRKSTAIPDALHWMHVGCVPPGQSLCGGMLVGALTPGSATHAREVNV
jgi:hypothetical protein